MATLGENVKRTDFQGAGMVFDVSVRQNMDQVTRSLDAFAQKQIPFATAKALTGVAKQVQAAQKVSLPQVFDRPTPFTLGAIGVKAATKASQQAVVFVKDIAASYLAPYEFGGLQKINGRALLVPKALQTNQYGNIPKGMLAKLKGRADIFIGAIKTKSGEVINGVWQRPTIVAPKAGKRAARAANQTGHLKLLIRFADAQSVKRHWGYQARAKAIIAATFNKEFDAAMAQAIASART